MSQCDELKKEIRCNHFLFRHCSPGIFVLFECGPRLLYPIWTSVWLIYHIAWFTFDPYKAYKDGNNGDPYYFIFLTNWGYIMLGFYNLVDFIVTLYVHCRRNDLINESQKSDVEEDNMPWYIKFLWILFETVNSVSLLITIAYYGLLTSDNSPSSVEKHAINSVYVLVNVFFCAKPIRLLHFIYPLLFGFIYSIFSVIYQVGGDGSAIYPVLDWDKAGSTIVYVVILVFIGVPIVHVLLFALYKLRIFLHDKCCKRSAVHDKNERSALSVRKPEQTGTISYM